ncbi:iron(III) transport system ATP-binding protein [Micromonospora pattaloongensis]|uniref:ABC-type quaternary amine transporter n=1 Tax=Micromonospora pattaloongensis TaxID=405436 RepID=A0A1H3FXA2_9ACTN|nr:ABC transporter ATP-binding protein [Micromonospora pattaloongensis]SDX94759.1 iron(III) transport system ATP-binding protein [Micromonospora pattaloongensis]
MSALSISDAEKAWGDVRALAGVSLTVPTGSLVAVLGPSGCGKTTLLRCVAGLERLDAGRIAVDGRDVAGPRTHVPTHRRRIALVPQEGALFPHLSVADNVGYGLDRATRRSGRIAEVLALVGLDGYGDRMPHQLSGGQQQRVALARALAPRPSLILLDEPFSALDAGLRADLRRDVRAALRADGATAVLVTHDQGEALSLADEVAVMRDGRVVQMGTPTSVYRTPADPWVAAFVGEAVLLPGTAHQGRAQTPIGTAPILPTAADEAPTPVTVLIRPEQLDLTAAHRAAPGAVTATVLRRDFHGHDTLTVVRLADGTELAARSLDGAEHHGPGSEVALKIRDTVLAWPRQRG